MLVIWIILVLLLIVLVWLLFAPIRLNIDSKKNEYLIRWGRLGKLTLNPEEEEWFFSIKIGFWNKKFFLSDLIQNFSKEKKEKVKTKKTKKSSFFNSFKRMRRVLKSFNVKICKINLDTDDYYLNALLIPFFQMINRGNQHWITINFNNKNDIQLIVENRIINVLYSIFR